MNDSADRKTLDDLLASAADLRPRPDFDSWRRQHSEAIGALEALPAAVAQQRKKRVMIRVARYSTISAALLLIIVAAAWWLVANYGARNAFAEVIDQLARVENATCQVRMYVGGQDLTWRGYLQGSSVRWEHDREGIRVIDFRKGKMLETTPRTREARIVDVKDLDGQTILASNPIDDLLQMKDADSGRLADEAIGNTLCHVYRVAKSDSHFFGGPKGAMKLWVNPRTNLPVQLHAVLADGLATLTFTDFRWNQEIDQGLFVLRVPEGYELVEQPGSDETSEPEKPLSEHAPEGQPATEEDEFTEMADTLEMLGQKIKANYDAMSSWSGTYQLVDRSLWEGARSGSGRAVWQVSNALASFSIDPAGDRIRADYRKTEPTQSYDAETGKLLTATSRATQYRWLRTPEHFLHFPLDRLQGEVPGFPAVEGFGPARQGRIFYREGPQAAEHYQNSRWYVDPRTFLGNGTRTSWETCFLYAKSFRGELGPESLRHSRKNKTLVERRNGSATEYVLTRRNPDPAGGVDRSMSTSVFSSDAGFNLVSYELISFGKPEQERRCTFREVKGVFIPSEFETKRFRWADVEEAYLIEHRRYALKQVRLNEPLQPGMFEIENLGLEYGDRMVDRIENRLTVFDGKQFVPAEQFKLRPELLPGQAAEPRRD